MTEGQTHGLICRGTIRLTGPTSWAYDDDLCESGNLYRKSLARNWFDDRVLLQLVIKRLPYGLSASSYPN
jgi:hypothetical protein